MVVGMKTADQSSLRKVGDLAHATGVTVRTLHHYEQIGLLVPSTRSPAGHRLYDAAAVDRLYRIGLLRHLGFSLEQVEAALDDPSWNLRAALAHHARSLDQTLATATRIRARLASALSSTDGNEAARSEDLIAILEDMNMLEPQVQQRISILVYADLPKAYRFLTDVFGLTPGELTLDGEGNAVHGEVFAGDGVVWLHPESAAYRLASPQALGAATSTMALIVDDVDEHYRGVAERGGEIVYPPVDQPYGYREYSARDCDGGLWSFMKPLA
jgi:MerR family transcriptional regulator, thiopeptide resistance regulator